MIVKLLVDVAFIFVYVFKISHPQPDFVALHNCTTIGQVEKTEMVHRLTDDTKRTVR